MKAILRSARLTPKKANLTAGMVRRLPVVEALEILKFTPKKSAQMLYKLLASAVANAETNFKQDKKSLVVKEIVVTKGATLKRGVPVSRGRVYPILKRTSHITILLALNEAQTAGKPGKKESSEKAETTVSEKPKKAAAKKTAKKSTK